MTNAQRAKGFVNIAQLVVIAVALFGVGAIYLLRTPGKDANTNIPPQDKSVDVLPQIIVTDENFSQLFSTLKRIDGVDSVYSPRVEGIYSPEEAIRGALQLHNRFIEVRGAVTMAGRQPPQIQKPGDPVWMPSIGPAFVTPSGTVVLNNPGSLSNAMQGTGQFAIRGIFRVTKTDGVPTEYYLAIPPLCENCVTVLQVSRINPTPSPTSLAGQARIIRGHSTSGKSINVTLVHDKSNPHSLNNDFVITNNTHIAVSLSCGPVDSLAETILSQNFTGIERLPFLFSITGALDKIFVNRSNCSLSTQVFSHSGNEGIIGDLVNEIQTPIKLNDRNIEIRVFGLEDCNAPNAGGFCTSRKSSKYELYISHESKKYGGDPPTVLEGGVVPNFLIDVAKASHSLPEPFKKPFTIVATLRQPDGSTFQKSFSAGSSICHPYDPVGPGSTYPADPCQFIGLQPPIHFSFGDIPGGTLTQRGTYRITTTADNEDVKINDYAFSIQTSRIDSIFIGEPVAGYHIEQKAKIAPYFRHGENTDAFTTTYKNTSGTRNQRQLFEETKLLEVYIGISRSSEEVSRNEYYKYHSFLDGLNPANVFWPTRTTPEGSFLLLEIFGRGDFLAVWPSGKQFVQIFGYQTFEGDEQQFVREYLKKYPSSLR